jgi:hypothetical protein
VDDPTVLESGVKELLDGIEPAVASFSDAAPDKQRAPFVIYQKISRVSDQWDHLRGPANIADARMQVSSYADKKLDAVVLAGRVRQTLNGFRGTLGCGVVIRSCRLDNELGAREDATDPKLFRVDQDYLITHTEI